MIILDRYIVSRFAMGMVPVLLLLLAMFSFLELAEELEDVGKGTFTQLDAFLVVLYTTPARLVDLMPVTTLLGGLMGLGAMANHQELIAARSAGMSRARMASPVFGFTLVLAAMVVLFQTFLIPASEREAIEIRSGALEKTSLNAEGQLDFWTRSGRNFVHVEDVLFNRILLGVEIYNVDGEGRLQRLIRAEQASIIGGDTWLLKDVVRSKLGVSPRPARMLPSLEWTGLLSSEQAEILMLPLKLLAPYDLLRYIQHLETNELDTQHFRIIFWKQISLVLSVIAMGLLSLPMLAGSTRFISASQRIVIGGLVGISFYLLQQLTGHLANLFGLLPSITVMTPVLLLLAVAVLAQFWHGFGSSKRADNSDA